ncbi:MAG: protein kinase [archaeon]
MNFVAQCPQLFKKHSSTDRYTVIAKQDSLLVAVAEKRKFMLKKQDEHSHEADVLPLLDHPNIVQLHDVTALRYPKHLFARAHAYAVLEFIDGENLHCYRQGREMTPDEIIAAAAQLADATAYLHGKGFIHNDLKPHNIVMGKRPKIVDFDSVMRFDEKGFVNATPGYRSLQMRANENMSENDIFGLGVVIYFMDKGISPYLEYTAGEFEGFYFKEKKFLEKGPAGKMRIPQLVSLVNGMLSPRYQDRPTMKDVQRTLCSLSQ